MTATLVVTFVGIALIAAVGFLGRRGAITDVSDWAVANESKFQKPEAVKDAGAGSSGGAKTDAGAKKK